MSSPATDRRAWDSLAQALGGRYTLERELGRGAMATVYLARDLARGQPVAVKVMDSRLANAIGAARFLREIAIAGSMSHPLIVPLYDSGEAVVGRESQVVGEGLTTHDPGPTTFLYYTMPYVEGESLYERLQRERRLALDDALRITLDVAAALEYAHGRGVLHRDVKPENILLAGRQALVADFGLARAISAADSQKLTATGVIVGTVYYMSPEQLREDRDLDERADIYSLGCTMFEMLTGGPPYTGPSLKEVVTRILRAAIPSAQRLNAGVPAAVDQAIARALAKSASERFATMRELAAALPRPKGLESP